MLSLILDTETTGLSPVHDRVCEIGVVLTDWKEIYCALRTYINPQMDFENSHNGLNSFILKDAPTFHEILPIFFMLLLYADEYVAHNYKFDARFLQEELSREGLRLPYRRTFDTMRAARGRNLQDACRAAGVSTADLKFHTALDDAIGCFRLAASLRPRGFEGVDGGGEPALALTPRFS